MSISNKIVGLVLSAIAVGSLGYFATARTAQADTAVGGIDILVETFDQDGKRILPVPTSFTFVLDGSTRTAVSDNAGRARFSDVTVGTHTVTQNAQTGWNQVLVTPTGGVVDVPENDSAGVVFKNKQSVAPPAPGRIEILKEGFSPSGVRLTSVPAFTFVLDGGRTTTNDSSGRATFDNVTPGTHTVTEVARSGWTQVLVTPTGGTVDVPAGDSAGVVFKNKQDPTLPPPVNPQASVIEKAKTAFNETQQVDATVVKAHAGDVIRYGLITKNSGDKAETGFVVSDDLSDVLQYATITDLGGGSMNGSTIQYPAETIAAGATVTRSFKATVKAADQWPASGDLTMTNTYGNTVNVPVESQPAPVAPLGLPAQPQGVTVLPQTGPAETALAVMLGVGVLAYFVRKARKQLIDSVISRGQ